MVYSLWSLGKELGSTSEIKMQWNAGRSCLGKPKREDNSEFGTKNKIVPFGKTLSPTCRIEACDFCKFGILNYIYKNDTTNWPFLMLLWTRRNDGEMLLGEPKFETMILYETVKCWLLSLISEWSWRWQLFGCWSRIPGCWSSCVIGGKATQSVTRKSLSIVSKELLKMNTWFWVWTFERSMDNDSNWCQKRAELKFALCRNFANGNWFLKSKIFFLV